MTIMELNHSTSEPAVRISNHGRITIPAKLRKKYHLQDGDEVVFIEDEGSLRELKYSPLKNSKVNQSPPKR